MTLLSLFALAAAMLLLAITPGPGVFATVARALSIGFSRASVVVLGIVAGDLIFLLLAIYGLSAAAELLGGFFAVIRYLGAAYLIWLGIKLWKAKPRAAGVDDTGKHSWQATFFSGLFITLGNPKVILFYLGFLPTFVELPTLTTLDVFAVTTVVSVVLAATLLAYAYAASRARKLFRNPGAERILNRSAGSAMVATGAVLAAKT